MLLAGCNEIGMILALAIPLAGFLFQLIRQRQAVYWWIFLFLVSILCTLIILKSPATFYRMEASGSFARSIPMVGMMAISGMMMAIFHWFSSPSLWLFLPLIWLFTNPETTNLKLSTGWKIAIGLASFFLLYFCFLPSFLGEGLVQGHTENTLLFLFLILVCINIRLWKVDGQKPEWSIWQKNGLMLAFLFFLPFSPGFRLAVSDLTSGEAAAFSSERDSRDSLMRNFPGDTVFLEPLHHKPKSLFAGDIGDYPDPWYDNHFAAMYRKKWVQLKNKPVPKPVE
jgi:hypothetical protein